jgi:sulfatase modifying factor 1
MILGGALCFVGVALAGCGELIGLGGLHDRADGDGGGSSEEAGPPGGPDAAGSFDAGPDATTPTKPSDAGIDAQDAGGDTPCAPTTQRCAGTGGVETCSDAGVWGAAWPCATKSCTAGACAGSTSAAPSCQGGGAGRSTCGPDAGESCCLSLEVPGGKFFRTYDPDAGPAGNADPATVSGFQLDKYLVTVGRFRAFLNATMPPDGGILAPVARSGKHAHLNGGNGLVGTDGGGEPGWVSTDDSSLAPTAANLGCDAPYPTWTSAQSTNESLPINCVNWWEAYAFCIWDEGFLPSEAEWQYAVAGGSLQRLYPWGGDVLDLTHVIAAFDYPGPGVMSCTGTGCIAPVGTDPAGAGVWGQLDLVGEVYEWSLDYGGTGIALPNPCVDCADLTPAASRAGRGGDFAAGISQLSPTKPGFATPVTRSDGIGFRCARTP